MTNLLIIDCHDLGQHLGSYGWSTSPTQHIDHLAARGIRFENHFATAPQCSPSRSGIYTGRYPHANGILGLAHDPFNWRFHPDEKHLATLLKNAGYHTALIGIQHVTGHDLKLISELGYQDIQILIEPKEVAKGVKNYLSKSSQEPFFLKIGFFYPHRDHNGRFKQAPPDKSLGVEAPAYLPQTQETRDEMAEFQGVIAEMDRAVGEIWSTLEETGLLENTWVIFTTDHGIAMPRAKCTLYDPGIETALIMYSEPFNLRGGKVYQDLISNVDLVPTILDMLEIEAPSNIQGKSFANLIQEKDYVHREEIFAEKTFHTAYEPQRAIRTKRFKLIWNLEAGIMNVPGDIMHSPIYPQMIDQITQELPYFELYDLENDALEKNNLIENPEYQSVRKDLTQRLLKWMQETDDPLLKGAITSPFYQRGKTLLENSKR